MIRLVSVFDFDGTLVDSSHRYRSRICADGIERIDLAHWMRHEPLAIADTPLPLYFHFQRMCADPSVYTIIATARIWCNATRAWARRFGCEPDKIVARRDRSDTRGGAELKLQALVPLLNLRQFRSAAVEVWEDNTAYLKTICDRLDAFGHYVPSRQGH